jgi:hypothetical protein
LAASIRKPLQSHIFRVSNFTIFNPFSGFPGVADTCIRPVSVRVWISRQNRLSTVSHGDAFSRVRGPGGPNGCLTGSDAARAILGGRVTLASCWRRCRSIRRDRHQRFGHAMLPNRHRLPTSASQRCNPPAGRPWRRYPPVMRTTYCGSS